MTRRDADNARPPVRDDETIEALIAGEELGPDLEPLVAFVRDVRTVGSSHPPVPSPALNEMIAAGGPPDLQREPGTIPRPQRPTGRGRRYRRTLTIAVATLLALAVLVSGIASALPGPAAKAVRRVIELVTAEGSADEAPRGGNRERATTHSRNSAAARRDAEASTTSTHAGNGMARGRPDDSSRADPSHEVSTSPRRHDQRSRPAHPVAAAHPAPHSRAPGKPDKQEQQARPPTQESDDRGRSADRAQRNKPG